jgi:epoxyqueuosine reductase
MGLDTSEAATRWQVVLREAQALGLAHVGCTPATELPEHALYTAWLAADRAGEMTYLGRDAEARRDPRRVLEKARSVVVVALSYCHPEPPLPLAGLRGQIARYARAEDYHLVLKRRLSALAERILVALASKTSVEGAAPELAYRVCVDTAPLLERGLGAHAGLGFIGKNTLLITPGVGSYTVLGELLLECELSSGQPLLPRCGSCELCIDACPTGALQRLQPFQLDSRRCISYLTIENSGPIPLPFRRAIGTWVFGCDICQEVCPWNTGPSERDGKTADAELRPRPQQSRPELLWLLGLGAAQFRRFVRRTALRRTPRSQLLRNVAVALGNVGTAAEVPALAAALRREPALVRQHLAWALGEIGRRDVAACRPAEAALQSALPLEPDATVREEIAQALAALK